MENKCPHCSGNVVLRDVTFGSKPVHASVYCCEFCWFRCDEKDFEKAVRAAQLLLEKDYIDEITKQLNQFPHIFGPGGSLGDIFNRFKLMKEALQWYADAENWEKENRGWIAVNALKTIGL